MCNTKLKEKTCRVIGGNMMIPQYYAPTRTLSQSQYRRGFKLVATPPPIMKPQPFSVGVFCLRRNFVFLSDRASCRVLLGVPAKTCGLRRPTTRIDHGHISLSPSHYSLRLRSPNLAQSPQRPQAIPLQINKLRADESSGWIAALDSKRIRRVVICR